MHEAKQQHHKQSGAARRCDTLGEDRLADAGTGGACVDDSTATGQATGAFRAVGSRRLGDRTQILDDLLVQFGARHDRENLRRPPRHTVVSPVPAGVALAHVARHGQPQLRRQYQVVATALSVREYLPQLPAPGSLAAKRVRVGFRGRERGYLESAQYRLAVLASQPPGVVDVRAQFCGRVSAVQSLSCEQVVHLLPGFGQRGHDLLQPAPQPCPPRRGTLHIGLVRHISGDVGLQRFPVHGIDSGRQPGRERALGRDAKQPVPQAVRARQLGGIIHRQIGDDKSVMRRGDRGIRIGPQPFGAAAKHRVAMLADYPIEHRRADPFRNSLPEPPDQRGIGLPPVARRYERPLHSWPAGPADQQDATASPLSLAIRGNPNLRSDTSAPFRTSQS